MIMVRLIRIILFQFSHIFHTWNLIDYDRNIELSWAMWKDLYLSAIDQTVPKLKWHRQKVKHWFNHDTISLIHKKRIQSYEIVCITKCRCKISLY